MKFDRRSLLKAAAGAPLLSVLAPRAALGQTMAAPKRIVFWFQPCGVTHRHYHVRPDSTENDWGYDAMGDLHSLLPLVPFKDLAVHFDSSERLSTLALPADDWTKWTDNQKMPFGLTDLAGTTGENPLKPRDMNGNPTREFTVGHESQIAMMTGRFPVGTVVSSGGTSSVEWATQGDSIDVALGKALGTGTRFKSLQLGLASYVNFGLSYDAGVRLPIQDDPRRSFETMFMGIPQMPGVDPAAEALRLKMARRSAAFSTAYERFTALKSGMASPDQKRLQQHFDAYRDVQLRLTQAPVVNMSCHAPAAPASNLNLGDALTLPARMQLMMDQAVLGLACDLTRVMTITWTFAATNQIFSFLPGFDAPLGPGGAPSPDGHHPLSHDAYNGTDDPSTAAQLAAYDKKRRIERWYAERLASFLTALRNVQEADGSTLLDNTVVVVINEINHSGAHNNSNMPIRLYGDLKGKLRTGRYLALPTTPLNNLYVSLANALDLPWTTFGEPRFDYRYIGGPTRWQWASGSSTVGPIPGLVS
ncbi:MAG: DUF1552 domain-containing protein [Archangium sp.]